MPRWKETTAEGFACEATAGLLGIVIGGGCGERRRVRGHGLARVFMLPLLRPLSGRLFHSRPLSELSRPLFGLSRPLFGRFFHSRPLPAACSSCHSPLPSPLPACTHCWSISALPPDVTHHQLFDLPGDPNSFSVSLPLLKRRFLLAQTICHPDAWSSKGPVSLFIANRACI